MTIPDPDSVDSSLTVERERSAASVDSRLAVGTPDPVGERSSAVADLLERAAERIERTGLYREDPTKDLHDGPFYRAQDGLSNDECAVCAVGAIRWAEHGDPERWTSGQIAELAMRALFQRVGYVPSWSDSSSAETVTTTLRSVAAELRDSS